MPAKDLYERSQEIGQIIQQARSRARKSIRQCATYLGTSRERYAGFETGKVYISVVEMEALMLYLGIPHHEIWPTDIGGDPDEVVLEAMPGQSVRIKVNVALVATVENGDSLEPSSPPHLSNTNSKSDSEGASTPRRVRHSTADTGLTSDDL